MSSVVNKNVLQRMGRRLLTHIGQPRHRYTSVAACIAVLSGANMAHAQTRGFQVPVSGGAILNALGFGAGQQPSTFDDDTPSFITFNNDGFNVIYNPYMAVVIGVNGTFGVSYDAGQLFGDAVTLTHTTSGMLSFGNLSGSLRKSFDDKRALNGFNWEDFIDASGAPVGYGLWPLPGRVVTDQSYDYSAYVAANVDGVQAAGTVTGGVNVPVAGGNGWVVGREPAFRSTTSDNILESEAVLTDNVTLQQQIRLFRNTAQMRWVIRNNDLIGHRVYLKFVVNHHGASSFNSTNGTIRDDAYFFADPVKGPTLRSQVYGLNPDGAITQPIPDKIEVFGARYQPDTQESEPFHSRHILNGFGATAPTTVFFGDSEDLWPLVGFAHSGLFSPPAAGVRYDKLEDGAAVAVYFGPYNVPAGSSSQPIITYYGNGSSDDRFDSDFAIGTEAEEALQYNAAAAVNLTDIQKGNPTLNETAKAFLTPQQLTIVGSVYNRQLSEAQFDITLKDVKMSVTLPDGLRFGTNTSTGQQDTATKTVGDVPGDTDAVQRWVAEPTGDVFGTVSYQFTTSIGGIAPLSRTVSRAVTIPATPLYNVTADAYQMIGFPFDFDKGLTNNGDSSSIINGLSKPRDDNPGSRIFYKWVPDPDSVDGTGRYQPVTTLERGVGYYYRPALSRLLFLNGAKPDENATPVAAESRLQFFQMVLERGWNMISNPWVYSVPVSYISLAAINPDDPTQNFQQTSFPDAVSSGLVRGGIFFYNPAKRDYDFFQDYSQELKPYQAYWIYVDDRRILRIAVPSRRQSAVIPAADGSIPPTRARKESVGAIASGRAFPINPTNENWKIQLTAKRSSSDSANDGATLLGVSPNSKDGDDSRDLPKPPPIVKDYVSVRILHEGKSGKIGRYAQDLKAPGKKKSWDLEVVSDTEGPVTLAWPNMGRLPKSVRLTLTDGQTGRKVSLRGTSSITVNVAANTPSRFTITADKQASQPLMISNFTVTTKGRGPNGGTNYSFNFNVTADASVDGRIMTLSGKTVSVLATGRAVSVGASINLPWNSRSQEGNALPAGNYMVEINARTENGEPATIKRPLLLLR